MKTDLQSLTLAAALAVAGLVGAASQAHGQSSSNVYSVNVVGYVTETLTNCYTFVANPLQAYAGNPVPVANNDIGCVIPFAPEGTSVWVWNTTNQVFDGPSVFVDPGIDPFWTVNLELPVGRGFVIHSCTNWTLTFVGEVLQGTLTTFVAGSNRLSLIGSLVPQAGLLSAELEFPGSDGDEVYLIGPTGYLDACTFYTGYGWFVPLGSVDPGGPMLKAARPFFVRHPGPDTNWVRNFWVPDNQPSRTRSMLDTPLPRILSLTLRDGTATLKLSQTGTPYDVQWSGDGFAWTTVATKQTDSLWKGSCPPGARGYFQLSQP